jgi:hypothetical protein
MKRFFVLLIVTLFAVSRTTKAAVPRDPVFEEYPDQFLHDVEKLSSRRLPKFDARRHLQGLFDKYDVQQGHRELFIFRNIFNFLFDGSIKGSGKDSSEDGLSLTVHFAPDNNEVESSAAVPTVGETSLTGGNVKGKKSSKKNRKRIRGRV